MQSYTIQKEETTYSSRDEQPMTKVTWVSSITGDNRLAFHPKAWTFPRFSFISQQRDASSFTTNSNSIKGWESITNQSDRLCAI